MLKKEIYIESVWAAFSAAAVCVCVCLSERKTFIDCILRCALRVSKAPNRMLYCAVASIIHQKPHFHVNDYCDESSFPIELNYLLEGFDNRVLDGNFTSSRHSQIFLQSFAKNREIITFYAGARENERTALSLSPMCYARDKISALSRILYISPSQCEALCAYSVCRIKNSINWKIQIEA